MSTNAVVRFQKPDDVRLALAAAKDRLVATLPAGADADRFMATVAKAIIGNPRLMECTQASLMRAVSDAAELGLTPTGLLGSAYLVPYKNRRTGQMDAQLIPGYRGLVDLARRSGQIQDIVADVIRQKDTYRIVKGTDGRVEHEPFIPDPTAPVEDRDPGRPVGAYMVAWLRNSPRPHVEWMTTDEIEAVRKRSKASDDGPWVTDWSEMARKTVVRRGSKYLPLSTQFEAALSLDEEAEREAEAPAPVTATVLTPAQRILAQRMEAQMGTEVVAATEDGAAVTADGEVLTQEAASPPTPAQAGPEAAPATAGTAAPSEPEPAPPTATQVCGDDGGMLGRCSRAPGHTGRHDSGQGQWAQERKR